MAWLVTPPGRARTIPGLTLLPLYFELDGTFPNHEANPLEPANLVDLQKYVGAVGRLTSVPAFDGDADRLLRRRRVGADRCRRRPSPRWWPPRTGP